MVPLFMINKKSYLIYLGWRKRLREKESMWQKEYAESSTLTGQQPSFYQLYLSRLKLPRRRTESLYFFYIAFLVAWGAFEETEVCVLSVGPTHEGIDQALCRKSEQVKMITLLLWLTSTVFCNALTKSLLVSLTWNQFWADQVSATKNVLFSVYPHFHINGSFHFKELDSPHLVVPQCDFQTWTKLDTLMYGLALTAVAAWTEINHWNSLLI